MSQSVFIYSPALETHAYPADCPFNSRRAGLTRRTLLSLGLLSGADRAERAPAPATREELLQFHTPRYLNALEKTSRGDLDLEGFQMGLGTPDCPVFLGMYDYAALACGASLLGARLILAGEATVAFNPSGGYHHAFPAKAAGFCYLNDVVLACQFLATAGRRVLFLDVDAHHSDGVQAAFYERNDVMTISLHESGKTLFPGAGFEDEIGVGVGRGYSVNLPLPAGTYDDAFLRAFHSVAPPLIDAFNPDVIVLEVGLDGLAGDPLAHLSLTNNAYAEIIGRIRQFQKPILMVGGGGYNVPNTVRGWALAWSVLCGAEAENDFSIGMGGVMLQSAEWSGGLRDRALTPEPRQRAAVDRAIAATIARVQQLVFPLHGLPAPD